MNTPRELLIVAVGVLCFWIGLAVFAVASPPLRLDVAFSAIGFGLGLLWAAYLGSRGEAGPRDR